MILCCEEASEVLAAAHHSMCYHVIKESLYTVSAFTDGLWVICMPSLEVDLQWNRWNNTGDVFNLQSLYQPFKITVAPVNLYEWKFWVILELGDYLVKSVASGDTNTNEFRNKGKCTKFELTLLRCSTWGHSLPLICTDCVDTWVYLGLPAEVSRWSFLRILLQVWQRIFYFTHFDDLVSEIAVLLMNQHGMSWSRHRQFFQVLHIYSLPLNCCFGWCPSYSWFQRLSASYSGSGANTQHSHHTEKVLFHAAEHSHSPALALGFLETYLDSTYSIYLHQTYWTLPYQSWHSSLWIWARYFTNCYLVFQYLLRLNQVDWLRLCGCGTLVLIVDFN